jgi:hypothetical protein
VEGLSHFLAVAKNSGRFKGIKISPGMYITHLLFVDDILIFCDGTKRDADKLFEGLTLFKKATGMLINAQKSSILFALSRKKSYNIFYHNSLTRFWDWTKV